MRTKWQYLQVELPGEHLHAFTVKMNELGQDGWECYHFGRIYAYFKRPALQPTVHHGPLGYDPP